MSEKTNNLVGFLLRMVQDPDLAAQFREDPSAIMANANLSDEDAGHIQAMMPAANIQTMNLAAAAPLPNLAKGHFYAGNDDGSHIFSVSTANQAVTNADKATVKANRIEMSTTKGQQQWPHPPQLILAAKGDRKVYLDHLLDSNTQLTGTITAFTIDID